MEGERRWKWVVPRHAVGPGRAGPSRTGAGNDPPSVEYSVSVPPTVSMLCDQAQHSCRERSERRDTYYY